MNQMENSLLESYRIKRKTCEKCKEQLKNVLSDKQLQLFEDIFYKESEKYIFQERKY